MMYVLLAAVYLVGAALVGFLCFKTGYSVGWDERQKQMTLPPKRLADTTRRHDDDQQHERHSAMDPKKAFWH